MNVRKKFGTILSGNHYPKAKKTLTSFHSINFRLAHGVTMKLFLSCRQFGWLHSSIGRTILQLQTIFIFNSFNLIILFFFCCSLYGAVEREREAKLHSVVCASSNDAWIDVTEINFVDKLLLLSKRLDAFTHTRFLSFYCIFAPFSSSSASHRRINVHTTKLKMNRY